MNLRVFRSMNIRHRTKSSLKFQPSPPWFHGIAVSTRPWENHSKWISQLHPQNVEEAANMLDKLSLLPTDRLPEFIVFHNHPSTHTSTDGSLSFLREILPLGAQFCEDHPTVGSNYRRLNAHGKPLNDHVVGICHSFPNHSIAELAIILDVFLPTRLAVSPQTIVNTDKAVDQNKNQEENEDDWDAVVKNTDMVVLDGLDFSNNRGFDNLAKRIWEAQEQDGARNTYAISSTDQEAKWLRQMWSIHGQK